MLAALTGDGLFLLSRAQLKTPQTSVPVAQALPSARALCWSPSNSTLFVAATKTVYQYDTSCAIVTTVYESDGTVTALIAAENHGVTLVMAVGSKVVLLSGEHVHNTFETHRSSSITAIALSNDGSLLASASATAVHIHNLGLAPPAQMVLRNLPPGKVTTACFHLHWRTRLLLGVGNQLVIYDTTRPSAPLKVVPMSWAVAAVSCSPFSKTLVAVGGMMGEIGMVDLEKEKPLFKTLTTKQPTAALSFSAEGAAIYIGTGTGSILALDLRNIDREPKSISISDRGKPILALSVQSKFKCGSSTDMTKAAKTSKTTRSLILQGTDTSVARGSSADPKRSALKNAAANPYSKRFHDGPSAQELHMSKPTSSPTGELVSDTLNSGSVGSRAQKENIRSEVPVAPSAVTSSPSRAHDGATNLRDGNNLLGVPRPGSSASTRGARLRTLSSVSTRSVETACNASTRSMTERGTASRPTSPLQSGPEYASALASWDRQPTRTPSPDPPAPEPVAGRNITDMNVLGFETPELKQWVAAGKGQSKEGRRVGFADDKAYHSERRSEDGLLELAISPVRSFPNIRASGPAAMQLSPLRFLSRSPARSPSAASSSHAASSLADGISGCFTNGARPQARNEQWPG